MAHHDEYYYNEHDESQVEKILKTKKKKKIQPVKIWNEWE